jgi:hypothetical protein
MNNDLTFNERLIGVVGGLILFAYLKYSYPRWFANAVANWRFGLATFFVGLALGGNPTSDPEKRKPKAT